MKSYTFDLFNSLFLKSLVLVLGLSVCSCHNESGTPTETSEPQAVETPPAAEPAADFAISGTEKPSMKDLGNGTQEYIYQHYKVKTVAADSLGVGHDIFVYNEKGEEVWKSENKGDESGKWFSGISGDHALVDIGTGPSGRVLVVYDLKHKKVGFKGGYFGEPSISNGMLVFDRMVSEKEAGNINCPEKEEWKKQQLGIGYGQRVEYDLQTGAANNKQEFKCYAVQ